MGKKLIHEDPIVPVYIDRDQELQAELNAYYYSAQTLASQQPYVPQQQPAATGYYTPPGQYPPVPQWQGYGYPPQAPSGYPGVPPQAVGGYPGMPPQPTYPGYAPNPGYPAYQQPSGYAPPPNPYGAQPSYPGYGQPPAPMPQAGWAGYGQPYGGYGQPPQPAPYQQGYPSYPGYAPPSAPPNQEVVKRKHKSTEHSAGPGSEMRTSPPSAPGRGAPPSFGWKDLLQSDLDDYDSDPYRPPSSGPSYAGQAPIQESAVAVTQSSQDHVYDYYAQQFEQLRIGWNV